MLLDRDVLEVHLNVLFKARRLVAILLGAAVASIDFLDRVRCSEHAEEGYQRGSMFSLTPILVLGEPPPASGACGVILEPVTGKRG